MLLHKLLRVLSFTLEQGRFCGFPLGFLRRVYEAAPTLESLD